MLIKSTLASIKQISSELTQVEFLFSERDTQPYGSDYTEDLFFQPTAVCFPESTNEVSEIMKRCYVLEVPVFTRGAGTGLSGACLPVSSGLVLSTKKAQSNCKHRFTKPHCYR